MASNSSCNPLKRPGKEIAPPSSNSTKLEGPAGIQPFETHLDASDLTPNNVAEVIKDFPLEARTRCTAQVLVATGAAAEYIRTAYTEWRTYRADGLFIGQVMDRLKHMADPKTSTPFLPTPAIKAVLTLDMVRKKALQLAKTDVAVEAAKLELDCLLFCQLCAYENDKRRATELQQAAKRAAKGHSKAVQASSSTSKQELDPIALFMPHVKAVWFDVVETIKGGDNLQNHEQATIPGTIETVPSTEQQSAITTNTSAPNATVRTEAQPGPSAGRTEDNGFDQLVESMIFRPGDWVLPWEDIVLDEVRKKTIMVGVLSHCIRFNPVGINGILLYGPPGTGKSMLVASIATHGGITMLQVTRDKLMSMWVGKSEKILTAVFDFAVANEPCIIYFDEIDALVSECSDLSSSSAAGLRSLLLTLWADVANQKKRVMVIGTTNRPELISQACLRRTPLRVHVGLPDEEMQARLIALSLNRMKQGLSEEDADELSALDMHKIKRLVRHLRDKDLSGDDIQQAISACGASANRGVIEATHFLDKNGKLYACGSATAGAMAKGFRDLTADEKARCHWAPLNFSINEASLARQLKNRRSVNTEESLAVFERFEEEHGS